jgi:hypothetical protein
VVHGRVGIDRALAAAVADDQALARVEVGVERLIGAGCVGGDIEALRE